MPTKKPLSAEKKKPPSSPSVPPAPKAPGKKRKPGLTPRQKRLVQLAPAISSGKITKKAAALKAGYKESSANQQAQIFGSLRTNSAMQEALRKVGFTEEFIATKLVTGAKLLRPGKAQLGYVMGGADLLDVAPVKKQINAAVGLDDLIQAQEGGSTDAE